MTHPLKTYLERHGLTEAEFAERASRLLDDGEVAAGYISQIIIGYRKPGSALAVAIADATNGHVTIDDLLRFSRQPKSKRSKRAA